jgi:hypothetical protein
MAIFAVPLETQVGKPSDATLRAKDSAAFIHEAEDLVVFSPSLYKVIRSLDGLARNARSSRWESARKEVQVAWCFHLTQQADLIRGAVEPDHLCEGTVPGKTKGSGGRGRSARKEVVSLGRSMPRVLLVGAEWLTRRLSEASLWCYTVGRKRVSRLAASRPGVIESQDTLREASRRCQRDQSSLEFAMTECGYLSSPGESVVRGTRARLRLQFIDALTKTPKSQRVVRGTRARLSLQSFILLSFSLLHECCQGGQGLLEL